MNLGSFRLGDTLSQTVQFTNSNLPTSNDDSEALAAANGAGGSNDLGGGSISIAQNGQNLDLVFTPVAVPEPTTWGLLIAAAAGGLILRRWPRQPVV